MATDNYRDEIPWQLGKFKKRGTGMRPRMLRLAYLDALNWIRKEGFAGSPDAFVKGYIEPFVIGLRYDGETLSGCGVELLKADQDGATEFE
jgi:hypothetical protein